MITKVRVRADAIAAVSREGTPRSSNVDRLSVRKGAVDGGGSLTKAPLPTRKACDGTASARCESNMLFVPRATAVTTMDRASAQRAMATAQGKQGESYGVTTA